VEADLMAHERLTISTAGVDPRAADLLHDALALGLDDVRAITVADVVFLDGSRTSEQRRALDDLLVDPLLQRGTWDVPPLRDAVVIETALRPGVTDTAAAEVVRAAARIGVDVPAAGTGRRYEIDGDLDEAEVDRLVRRLLANPVIEHWAGGEIEPWFAHPAAVHDGRSPGSVEEIALIGLNGDELAALNAERGLSLDAGELLVIQKHFAERGRAPTDVELETLAQTWSEHCAHKTFRARLSTTDGESIEPLLTQLRRATDAIDAPFVRSAFVGNAGIVSFTPGSTIAVKAETHNHPSAVEPFGGANTGVGGVIRDVLGTAHLPIACTDVLCFGPADLPPDDLPDGVLHPRRIRSGVVAGVADYGNKIGLPTVAGAVLYHEAYTANPLVFCGCIGVAAERPPLDGPHAGDRVVVIGGRTGRDGIRGATFSSRTMDASTGEVAGASVQIGDPIVEKLLIDVIREAGGMYSAITDCGAGGLSSAVGEMAERRPTHPGGADVDVALAPLKYPGLAGWEIWLSEAQERMVLAVPPADLTALQAVCDRHGVELTDLGQFTATGRLVVRHGRQVLLDLDVGFLHDGRPQRAMRAELPRPDRSAGTSRFVADPADALLRLLAHPNIASKADTIHRYDHEILGATAVRPLVGLAGDGPADGVVLAALGDGGSAACGLSIGIGVNPWYGELDPERMAHAAVDEAIRNVVAAGADPDRVALLDNFSWGDPRRATTLGDLVAAVKGCCDAAVAHAAPFVSGKDSLNNEYVAGGERHAVPPTLVITAVAHVPDADRCVTPDLKQAGNAVLLVGRTSPEFGGSHLDQVLAPASDAAAPSCVPEPDPNAPDRYRRLHRVLRDGLVRAAHDCSEGGLAVALAEMAIGGRLGLRVVALPADDVTVALFAESTGRFVLEVAPDDVATVVDALAEPVTLLGTVTDEPVLSLPGCRPLAVDELVAAFTGGAA
jgi:phosphoribosylformylglycinamidine synthase